MVGCIIGVGRVVFLRDGSGRRGIEKGRGWTIGFPRE